MCNSKGLSPFIHAMHFCLILSDFLWTACIHDSFFLLPMYVNVLMVQQQLHYLFLLFPYELCSNWLWVGKHTKITFFSKSLRHLLGNQIWFYDINSPVFSALSGFGNLIHSNRDCSTVHKTVSKSISLYNDIVQVPYKWLGNGMLTAI